MPSFLEAEKARYAELKPTAEWLSEAARADGVYRNIDRTFCLPEAFADENLFHGTRDEVLRHFNSNRIQWHDGTTAGPSNHLCSSMVCGVNFLSPLMGNGEAATVLLKTVFGDDVVEAVPVAEGGFVEFEWVGDSEVDYLGEGLNRTRGANATSADAALAYHRPDGGKTLALVEWKYTESYVTAFKGAGSQGETRRRRYADLFSHPDSPIDNTKVTYEETLYEPFYQFMRQQLLAWQMQVRGREYGADRVRVLHLSPRANTDFDRVTAPALAGRFPRTRATALWRSLLKDAQQFTPAAIEGAFAPLLLGDEAGLAEWRQYIRERYSWAVASPSA